MALRCTVVILGVRNPLVILLISNIALVSGILPVSLIAIFCAVMFWMNNWVIINKKEKGFFI